MNMLANPTGKSGSFRAIDWIVEHNNLYTKVSFQHSYLVSELRLTTVPLFA
jgi:hypothetical protein